jgi:hypothetical protein
MARVVEAIAASPQVQGGEDDDEPNPPTCCDIAHARGFEDGIKSEEHRARVYAEMTATPQRAPGVTEGCAIQLSDDDWNPYELLDVVRHSLAASTPAVIVERIAECLRQQKQTQRAALAAPVSAPGVDEVRRVMPKGASLRDYLARLGCGELKPVDQMELANMLDDSINAAVDHFLAWELPQDFHPDNGISFTAPHPRPPFTWPVGTNLFTAVQAKAMFQHCLASGPSGVDGLTPSEALYAFAAWLTCRDKSITFGAAHDAAPAAEVVATFCEEQGFVPPRDDYHTRIKVAPAAQDQGEGNG